MLFIYGLVDPETHAVRYIGKSSVGLKRPRTHGNPSVLAKTKSYKANWIRSLQSRGLQYVILILECVNSPHELDDAERRWIAQGHCDRWPLTNLTAGGDGLANPSQETRAKIGEHSRKRMADPRYIELAIGNRRGKPLPEEWRAKIADAMRGRKMLPESIAKTAAAHRGQPHGPMPDWWRAKISAAGRGKKKPPGFGAKISKALKGKKRTPEQLIKLREQFAINGERRRGVPLTPSHRDNIKAALQRYYAENKRPPLSQERKEHLRQKMLEIWAKRKENRAE